MHRGLRHFDSERWRPSQETNRLRNSSRIRSWSLIPFARRSQPHSAFPTSRPTNPYPLPEAFDPSFWPQRKSSPPGRSPSPTRRLSPKSASGFQHPRQHRSSRSYFWARARKRPVNCVVMPGELLRELPRCQSLTKRKPSSPNARFGCSTTEASWPRSKPCCRPRMPLLSGMP